MSVVYTKKFKDGEIIFKAGEVGDCAYIIDSGRVKIYLDHNKNKSTSMVILAAGEIFGEMAIIDNAPRLDSAHAVGECQCTMISKSQLTEKIDLVDPIVRSLITKFIKKIRNNKAFVNERDVYKNSNTVNVNNFLEAQNNNVIEKIKFEKELSQALEDNEFEMYFQPIIDLKLNQIAGFEALIRWNSPNRGLVRPDTFMNIVEETSLIIPIGKRVFEQSCKAHIKINKFLKKTNSPIDKLFMSINVSGKQFAAPHFFRDIEAIVNKLKVDPANIKLEITETLLAEGEHVKFSMDKCRKKGFSISLDDFGTGFSSLSYLTDFNIDNLKLDKSFIKNMGQGSKAKIIVQSIIEMAKGLHIPVIAEGIETKKEKDELTRLGSQFGQGYYFAKPMPLKEAIEYIYENSTTVKVA